MEPELTQFDIEQIKSVISLAEHSKTLGGKPFAAILAFEGNVVHSSYDKRIENCDPTSHAELCVISEYCRSTNNQFLDNYTLYTSTEPCSMCSGAIRSARILRVVFSVSQTTLQQISGGKLKSSCRDILTLSRKNVIVTGPVLEELGILIFENYSFH